MAMRETVKSLRVYFLVVCLLATSNALAALRETSDPLMQISALVTLAIGLGFGFAGIRLPSMLSGSTAFIKVLVIGNMTLQALIAGTALLGGSGLAALIFPGIYLLVSWYLLVNVKRLAREAQMPAGDGDGARVAARA